MALITCEALSLGYEGGTVVSDLSFTVEKGDYLCIIGENGSGKSTLIRALLGLKEVSRGKIRYGDGFSRQGIGYLPQQTLVQRDFPATVTEIVCTGFLNRKRFSFFYSEKEKKEAADIMDKLSVSSYKEKSYKALSGGQQQRVLLARALCAAKDLLLLDEPTVGLDPLMSATLYRVIQQLNREGLTIIMVTHDMEAALRYASHILHLHKDTSFFGTKEEYDHCQVCAQFLDEGETPHD